MMELHHPELDDAPVLNAVNHSKHWAMIGSANWVIALGRLDVAHATNALARHSMAPREGHLIAMKRLFGFFGSIAMVMFRLIQIRLTTQKLQRNSLLTTIGESFTRTQARNLHRDNRNLESRKLRSQFMLTLIMRMMPLQEDR
jgi:hypothetical protein